jgi:hypothetical protein
LNVNSFATFLILLHAQALAFAFRLWLLNMFVDALSDVFFGLTDLTTNPRLDVQCFELVVRDSEGARPVD